METRSAKRKKKLATDLHHHHHHEKEKEEEEEEEEDRISDLPDDILHQILTHLPIQSVAQTSLLSKRFHTLWHSFPDLDFTTAVFSATSPPKPAAHISTLLLLRRSDIRLLRLRASLTFSRLANLLRHAVRRNVQELDVEVSTSDYFNFPRSLLTSPSLRTLRLKSWHPGFRLPPLHLMRDAFRSLSALSLSRPALHDRPSLVDLFTPSSFPLLKKLHLHSCSGMTRLRIESPALQDFALDSCFQLRELDVRVARLETLRVSSCFDSHAQTGTRVRIDCPGLRAVAWSCNAVTDECGFSTDQQLDCLHEAFVGFFRLDVDSISDAKVVSVSNLLAGVSGCRSLTLESQCVEIISKSNRVSLCHFNKLESLELSTGFDKHNNPGLANLFRSSPNVHTIVIKIMTDHNVERRRQWNKDLWQSPSSGEERYWESQTQYLKSFLRHLKVVKIEGFTECANDISLVKFFLKQGKVLQELFLCTSLSKPRDSLLREKIKSQIMGFSRASSNANIVFQ